MKENLKGLLAGSISACAVFVMCISVSATLSGKVSFNTVNLRHNGQQISAKGENYTIESGATVPASLLYTDENGGGTTYLPISRICSLLGVEIYWEGRTGSVYIGEKPREIPEYYAEFPAIPNLEYLSTVPEYETDFDSNPDTDKTVGYSSHTYCYRSKSIQEAEDVCEHYAQHLERLGFFFVTKRDHPILAQSVGNNYQYIFYSPDGKYEIEFYSLSHWADGYSCDIQVSIHSRISVKGYQRYICCDDVVDFGTLINASPIDIEMTTDQKTLTFYYGKNDYTSSDVSEFKQLLADNDFDQSTNSDTYTKQHFTVRIYKTSTKELAIAISHSLRM